MFVHAVVNNTKEAFMVRKMFRNFSLILLITLIAVLMTGCGGGGEKEFTDQDSGAIIEVSEGDEFKIVVEGNETTGYIWHQAEGTNEKIVEHVEDFFYPETNAEVGGGGRHTWVFEAVGQGETTIILEQGRPWETGVTPQKTVSYRVKVD
jgi:predicted secreted protein